MTTTTPAPVLPSNVHTITTDPNDYVNPALQSPTFWITAATTVLGFVAAMAALFGHPLDTKAADAVVGSFGMFAAMVATIVYSFAAHRTKQAAIESVTTQVVAAVQAQAQMAAPTAPSVTVTTETTSGGAEEVPIPDRPATARTTARRTTARRAGKTGR